MRGTDLSEAHLEEALLAYSSLGEAYIDGAHLEGALLFGADLRAASLNGATYDKTTVWPDGFGPANERAVLKEHSFEVSVNAGVLSAGFKRER